MGIFKLQPSKLHSVPWLICYFPLRTSLYFDFEWTSTLQTFPCISLRTSLMTYHKALINTYEHLIPCFTSLLRHSWPRWRKKSLWMLSVLRNDVINMSRAWDKENETWVPNRNSTYDLPYTGQMLIYQTHGNFNIADPSSRQDACHTWTLYMAQLATSLS